MLYEVITNYDELGWLIWCVVIIGFIVPIITIWKYNPDPRSGTYNKYKKREK